MGPQNGIIGTENSFDLPVMEVSEQDLSTEKNAAKFSKTREYKLLKQHFQNRIEYYQGFLPSGEAVIQSTDMAGLGQKWVVANAVIAELKAVLSAYDAAAEAVADAAKRS